MVRGLCTIHSDKQPENLCMYQEQVLSYKHLNEPLDEGRFVFECILAGNLRALSVDLSSECFHFQDTLDCILPMFGLTFSWNFYFLLPDKMFPCSNLY